jgi:predicted ATP-grasp superfamily ATP-dependent carboligase
MQKPDHAAVVLGMFETGLAVARSLGRAGIRVHGLDHLPRPGFRSRYVEGSFCPEPLSKPEGFIDHLLRLGEAEKRKPVLFATADEFLLPLAQNRGRLEQSFLMNVPDADLLESIADKYRQYELARRANIPVPATIVVATPGDVARACREVPFPVFIKAREVTSWRKEVGGGLKGFVANTPQELESHVDALLARGLAVLVQELIPGPDTNHFKACLYVSRNGEVVRSFALRKLRQQPPQAGFGSLVESVHEPEVVALGKRLLEAIGYRGVGSAEFKRDERDGKLKLIELNPRYWQQNALAARCHVDFPLAQYQDLVGIVPAQEGEYETNVKWLNLFADLDSFRVYRQRGELTFGGWMRELRGPKVYSNYAADDPLPGLYAVAESLAQRRPVRPLLERARRMFPKASNDD